MMPHDQAESSFADHSTWPGSFSRKMLEARWGCDAIAAGPVSQRRLVKDGGVAILPTEYGSKFDDLTR